MSKVNKYISLIVFNNTIAVPTMAKTEAGYYLAMDPVYVVEPITPCNLETALTNVIRANDLLVPALTTGEFRQSRDPVLAALKVQSWKKLAQTGLSFGIIWFDDRVLVTPSKLDKKGRFADDVLRQRVLPFNVTTQQLADFIIEDLRQRNMMD